MSKLQTMRVEGANAFCRRAGLPANKRLYWGRKWWGHCCAFCNRITVFLGKCQSCLRINKDHPYRYVTPELKELRQLHRELMRGLAYGC